MTTSADRAVERQCESLEGCKQQAKVKYGKHWFCLWHFYRLYRAEEMQHDNDLGGEAA